MKNTLNHISLFDPQLRHKEYFTLKIYCKERWKVGTLQQEILGQAKWINRTKGCTLSKEGDTLCMVGLVGIFLLWSSGEQNEWFEQVPILIRPNKDSNRWNASRIWEKNVIIQQNKLDY